MPSLKEPKSAKWVEDQISNLSPSCIVNATAFSAKNKNGVSPLDVGNVPIFQIALSTNDKKSWEKEDRGLSPTNMAMHVALPEIDGRIFAGVASFKKKMPTDFKLQFNEMLCIWDCICLSYSPPGQENAIIGNAFDGEQFVSAPAI